MGLKARLSSYGTKRANNSVNLVTSRKIYTRLARPIVESLVSKNVYGTVGYALSTTIKVIRKAMS